MKIKKCKICKEPFRQYSSLQNKCYRCTIEKTKPITKQGKRSLEYEEWKKKVAIPYLNKTQGKFCSECMREPDNNYRLEVDHIKKRSTHPELRMDLKNIRYLCVGVYSLDGCHQLKHK